MYCARSIVFAVRLRRSMCPSSRRKASGPRARRSERQKLLRGYARRYTPWPCGRAGICGGLPLLQDLEGLADGCFVNQAICHILVKNARNQRLIRQPLFPGSSLQFLQYAFCNPYVDCPSFADTIEKSFHLPAFLFRERTIRIRSVFNLTLEGIKFRLHRFFFP